MSGLLQRLLRHRWHGEREARRLLAPEALARIEAQVAASERRHSGEIRICIEAGLPLAELWQRASARDRALMHFSRLRVWDTEHNNGVLVYLLLADHAIELVADRGLSRRVPAAQWQALVAGMRQAFRARQFEQGLSAAIEAIDALLVQHFPLAAGAANPDELPNRPDIA